MTQEEIQIAVAVADVALAATVGIATVLVARTANRLMGLQTELIRLQTHAVIVPRTLEIHSHIASEEGPVNLIEVRNHSPLELDGLSLVGQIFGVGPGMPIRGDVQWPLEFMQTLPPRDMKLVGIDEIVNKAAELLPFKSSPLTHLSTVLLKLEVRYTRKTDGAEFHDSKILRVHLPENGRPMVVEFARKEGAD